MSCHVFFFRLNTLKGTVKTPAVDILRLNTLTGSIQNYFLTPEKCDEHPCPFRMGVPPWFSLYWCLVMRDKEQDC